MLAKKKGALHPFCISLAQVSRKVMVRLKTNLAGVLSESNTK
jgi:hypothetical protein